MTAKKKERNDHERKEEVPTPANMAHNNEQKLN